MINNIVKIHWPDGKYSEAKPDEDWLHAAKKANIDIPTGCLGGSCGACEIEVNGEIIRACIQKIPDKDNLTVKFAIDPYW